MFKNISFQFVACLFTFLTVSLKSRNFRFLRNCVLNLFVHGSCFFWLPKNLLPNSTFSKFSHIAYSKSFIVLTFVFSFFCCLSYSDVGEYRLPWHLLLEPDSGFSNSLSKSRREQGSRAEVHWSGSLRAVWGQCDQSEGC